MADKSDNIENSDRTIVVFGSSRPQDGTEAYKIARQTGKILAVTGYTVANGGYGGVMAASAAGVHSAGGRTIGVTCEAFGRGGPNQWVDEEIRTADLTERLSKLLELGDAYVALPGSTGTLLEIAACWERINKKFMPFKTIVCIGDYWRAMVDTIVDSGETHGNCFAFINSVGQLPEVLARALGRD